MNAPRASRFRVVTSLLRLLPLLAFLAGCGPDAEVRSQPGGGGGGGSYALSGVVQKGPFVSGGTVSVEEKYDVPDGTFHTALISSGTGAWSVGTVGSRYVRITATGSFFDEVLNTISDPVTLVALAEISGGGPVNVNLLTTLAADRMVNLINRGRGFTAARSQAESEVLAAFQIPSTPGLVPFSRMDITKSGDSHAILLAATAAFLNMAVLKGVTVASALAAMRGDIAGDGRLDSSFYAGGLANGAYWLNPAGVRSNLQSYYTIIGATITVPAFEPYLSGLAALYPWQGKTPLPQARYSATTSAVNGKIYLIGGTTSSVTGLVREYDPAMDTWALKTSMPTPREAPTSSVVNGKIYVIGGADAFGTVVGVVEEYDSGTDTWTNCYPDPNCAPMLTARTALASAVVEGKIYVFGGFGGTGRTNALEVYDPASNSWTTKLPMPRALQSMTASAVNGKIYVIGGSIGTAYNAVYQYEPGLDRWATDLFGNSFKSPMPTARFGLTSAEVNGRIYVIGGSDGASTQGLGTVEAYDPFTDTWATKSIMPRKRYDLTASMSGGKIYAFGGISLFQRDVVEEYDPAKD